MPTSFLWRRLSLLHFVIILAAILTYSVHAFAAAVAVDPTSNLGLLVAMLDQAGLGGLVKWVVCAVSIASLLDAALPQPTAGSHWLPIRMVVSAVALNRLNAANAGQPGLMTWIARVLQPLVDAQIARTAPKGAAPVDVSPGAGPTTQQAPIAPSAPAPTIAAPAAGPQTQPTA